jgi:hypothetical protein
MTTRAFSTKYSRHTVRWRASTVGLAVAAACMVTACTSNSPSPGSVSSIPSSSARPVAAAQATEVATAAKVGATAATVAGTGVTTKLGSGASIGAVTPTSKAPSSAVPPASHPPALTTEVSAPGGGNVTQTVAPQTVMTAAPIPLTATASFGGKITAVITKVARVKATAKGPGQIAGAAIAITLSIHNGTAKSLDLGGLVVNVADSAGTPQIPTSSDPSDPIGRSAAAGSDVQGTYVFTIQNTIKNPISVSVSYSTEAPVVLFVGDAK